MWLLIQDDAYEDEAFASEEESFDGDHMPVEVNAPGFGELSYENEFDDEPLKEESGSDEALVDTKAAMKGTHTGDLNVEEGTQEAESSTDKSRLTLSHDDAIKEDTSAAVTIEKQTDEKQESVPTSAGTNNLTPPSSPALCLASPRLSISVSLVPQEPRNFFGIAPGAVALALAANPNRSSPVDFERMDVAHTPRRQSSPFISRLPSVGEIAVPNMETGSNSSESSSDEDEPSPRPAPRVFIPQTHRASLESAKSWTNLLQSAVVAPPIARERSKSQPFITRLSSVSELVSVEDNKASDSEEDSEDSEDVSLNESLDDEDILVTGETAAVAEPTDQETTATAESTINPSAQDTDVQDLVAGVSLADGKPGVSKPLDDVKLEQDGHTLCSDDVSEKKPSLDEGGEVNPSENGQHTSAIMKEVAGSDANEEPWSDGPHWSRQSSVSEPPSEGIEEDQSAVEQTHLPASSEMEVATNMASSNDLAEPLEECITDDSSAPGIPVPIPSEKHQEEKKSEEEAQYDDDETIDEAEELAQETAANVTQSAVLQPILNGLDDEEAEDNDDDYEEQDYEEDDSTESDAAAKHDDQAQNAQEDEDEDDVFETEEQSRRETELLLREAEQLIKKQHEDDSQSSPVKKAFFEDDQYIEEDNAGDPDTEQVQFAESSEPLGQEWNNVDGEQVQYDGDEDFTSENTSQDDVEPEKNGKSEEPVSIMENILSEEQAAPRDQKSSHIEDGSSYDADEDFTNEDSSGKVESDLHAELQSPGIQKTSANEEDEEKPSGHKSDKPCAVQDKPVASTNLDQHMNPRTVNEQVSRAAKPTIERPVEQTRSKPSPPSRTKAESASSPSKSTLPRKPPIPIFRSSRSLKSVDGAILAPTTKEDESSKAEQVALATAPATSGLTSPVVQSSPPKQAFPPQMNPGRYYTLYVEEQPQLPRKAPVPKQPRSIKKPDAKEASKKLRPVKSPPHLRIELPNSMAKSKRDWLFLNMFRHGDDVSKYEPFVPNAAKSDAKYGAKRPISARRLVFGTEQTSADTAAAAYTGSAGIRRGRNLVSQDSSLRARERAWVATKPHESTIPAYDSILDKYCVTVTSPVIQRQIYQTRQRDLSPQLAYVLERRVEKQWDHGSSDAFGAVSTSYKTHIVPLGSNSGTKKG